MTISLYVRSSRTINTDSQRRCYDGCHFSSRTEWSDWERFLEYPTRKHAEHAARLFSRENQQFKVVES